MNIEEFYKKATGYKPYPYQSRLATCIRFPETLSVPTGVGKTAAATLAWLYRRESKSDATPRRLVYCLPMRTLVEQTEREARRWLGNLGLNESVAVHLLMGGADATKWDESPERDAILIGTQDMLLSRALNRGYGMSRYRWPMHFGLLNNDCLWVMDETQLMGVGLTTTAQLQGLRSKLSTYGVTHSLWMSATLDTSPIRTVDHPEPSSGFSRLMLTDADRKHEPVKRRLNAKKALEKSTLVLTAESEKKSYAKEFAAAVKAAHREGTLTLIVLNRVARAQDVFAELQKLAKAKASTLTAELALIHARFRPHDRRQHELALFSEKMPDAGRIVVATQAIEAGVDVSAATMFTELAPWPSLVQRFGRCNRGGEFTDARVLWIDAQLKDDKGAAPYVIEELNKSRQILESLTDVGPGALEAVKDERPLAVVHTLRRKDLLDLWDTTPDLAGNDLDVSRFIREGDDTDVQFFWRDFVDNKPPELFPAPLRDELCSLAVWRAREFLTKLKKNKQPFALVWKPLDKTWHAVDPDEVRPGMVLLLKPEMGGYLDAIGWTGDSADKPTPRPPQETKSKLDAYEDDDWGSGPITLTQHLNDVAQAAEGLRNQLSVESDGIPWEALIRAALWHDVGKAHPAFQMAMRDALQLRDSALASLWAKSGEKGKPNYRMSDDTKRNGFRHELASALAWLAHRGSEPNANLIAFLIAAHHGKVRGSLRSLPNETRPDDETVRFARGVWDGDELPTVEFGNGESVPATTLDLRLMELGEAETGPSWLARVLALRDQLGPFRLSYLETLLRIADWRGSKSGGQSNDR
ncbi:MAG: CRISPR-associated helicase Cas3' [Pirellulaceae bacterium]|nr:CRISPR-associated helicase Cas3' [Pirellulaceae bacterium]